MRTVVDTNVFISAALKEKSLPGMALYLVAQGGTLLKSAATEQELLRTIKRPRLAPLIPTASRDWLVRMMTTAETVTITERIAACRDSDDDKFLELTVNGRADIIVTGDADLLVLNPFRDIPIVLPAVFIQGATR